MTTDPDRAVDFYGQIFGWTAEQGGEEFGGYISFAKDSQGVGGAMQSQPDTGPPNVWSVYLSASDANATAEAAAQHGGRVHVPPMQVMASAPWRFSRTLVEPPSGSGRQAATPAST